MIRRPPRSTQSRSSAASDVYKRQVERGMKRAFRTILVADAVTASAAVILFLLAVGSVRGFALTLGLATVLDVLIAYFFTRPAVHVLAASSLSRNRLLGLRGALGTST